VPFVVPAVRFARISLVQTIVLLASLFAVAAVPARQAADTPKPPPGPNSDPTVHHQLGMDWGDRGYWKVVTPHEVAHQWWGHTVGFSSYRDQWMCEGFADMSASLCLSVIEKNLKSSLHSGTTNVNYYWSETHRASGPSMPGRSPWDTAPATLAPDSTRHGA
jgi:Peptidase family M1 domain